MRQEFRELELLDDITSLRFNNKLPPNIDGITRASILHSFRDWKGSQYIPKSMPMQLKWSTQEPFELSTPIEEATWDIIDIKKHKKNTNENTKPVNKYTKSKPITEFITAKGTKQLHIVSTEQGSKKYKKHILNLNSSDLPSGSKKPKIQIEPKRQKGPIGFIWNSNTYSCAYDALLIILLDFMLTNPALNLKIHSNYTKYLVQFSNNISQNNVNIDCSRIEKYRDILQDELHRNNPNEFNLSGITGTDIYKLAYTVLLDNNSYIVNMQCNNCKNLQSSQPLIKEYLWTIDDFI